MTKAKEPSFPFYSSDFLTGIIGLSWPDKGKYITLLCFQHTKGHLSPKLIKKIIGTFSEELKFKFLTDKDGNYYNERLENEMIKRDKFRKHQVENALKGSPETLPLELPADLKDIEPPNVVPKQRQSGANGGAKTVPLENEIYFKYKEVISKYRRIIPPSKKLVSIYCKIRENGIDADYFVEYYTARGWVYGKQKTAIVDWQAVVRTWEKNNNNNFAGRKPGVVNLEDLKNERRTHTS